MREIRLYGSEGGGAGCSPYPYQDTSIPATITLVWMPAYGHDVWNAKIRHCNYERQH